MYHVRSLAPDLAKDLDKRDHVLWRQLATHLLDEHRTDAMLLRYVVHVRFARWNSARDKYRFELLIVEPLRQPNNMARRSADIQARNYAEYFHYELRIKN